MEIRTVNEDTEHDAVIYGVLKSSGIPFHSVSHELIDPDAPHDSHSISYLSPLGLTRLRTSLFSHLESDYPFVHPTTLLQFLLHINRLVPHSVSVISRPEIAHQRSITFAPTPCSDSLAICMDGVMRPLTLTAPVGSVLHYTYLQ